MSETFIKDADYDPRTGIIKVVQQAYVRDVDDENHAAKLDGTNGWTNDRTMRRIAAIPPLAYSQWKHSLAPDVRDDRDKYQLALRRFIDEHPEWRTVDKILHMGPSPGYVFVK